MSDEEFIPRPPMRLRVLSCPGDKFFLILDRVSADTAANVLNDIGDTLNERLSNCGGLLVFTETVELEAFYPYG